MARPFRARLLCAENKSDGGDVSAVAAPAVYRIACLAVSTILIQCLAWVTNDDIHVKLTMTMLTPYAEQNDVAACFII